MRWTVWVDEAALLPRMTTLSQVAILEGEAKEGFNKRFEEIMASPDVQRNEEGRVPVSGVTYYAVAKRV